MSFASQSDMVVRIQKLSKCYPIFAKPQDRLKQMLCRGRKRYYKEFWALRDISLEIRRGETVGIIGRNGSGKSTLLQIVCGTLASTEGQVEVQGRIAALLELGAGFNPEFTGRENVYMNAALLGLSREQIDAKYEDMVAFADIGDFVDQPVKTYSSGMFVRLAFSVAIHADPDILIVDEALAVGDAAFQAKCMARMRQMMDSGLTLLFVSHDIGAVKSLCTRALLLDRGRMIAFGDTERVVDEYTRLLHLSSSAATPPVTDVQDAAVSLSFDDSRFRTLAAIQRMGNGKSTLLNVRLTDALGTDSDAFFYNSAARLQLQVRVNDPVPLLVFGYHVRDRNGVDVLYSDSLIEGKSIENPAPGAIYIIEWRLRLPLRNGQYNVACVISSPREEVTGTTYTCEDLVISDFVAVAAQFSVCGNTILHGFVHLDNEVSVTPWHQEQQKRVAHEGL